MGDLKRLGRHTHAERLILLHRKSQVLIPPPLNFNDPCS